MYDSREIKTSYKAIISAANELTQVYLIFFDSDPMNNAGILWIDLLSCEDVYLLKLNSCLLINFVEPLVDILAVQLAST